MADDDSLQTTCARHPGVETALRCGRCETPICPQCMVMTPVGARCPDCSPVIRSPLYSVTPLQYLRATAAGLGVAILGGLVAPVIPFFSLFALLLAGYGVGEVVSRAANRKAGRGLMAVAVVTTIVGMALGLALLAQGRLPTGVPLNVRLALGAAEALGSLFSFTGLFVLLAAALAGSRLR